jgi:hypothetical protein
MNKYVCAVEKDHALAQYLPMTNLRLDCGSTIRLLRQKYGGQVIWCIQDLDRLGHLQSQSTKTSALERFRRFLTPFKNLKDKPLKVIFKFTAKQLRAMAPITPNNLSSANRNRVVPCVLHFATTGVVVAFLERLEGPRSKTLLSVIRAASQIVAPITSAARWFVRTKNSAKFNPDSQDIQKLYVDISAYPRWQDNVYPDATAFVHNTAQPGVACTDEADECRVRHLQQRMDEAIRTNRPLGCVDGIHCQKHPRFSNIQKYNAIKQKRGYYTLTTPGYFTDKHDDPNATIILILQGEKDWLFFQDNEVVRNETIKAGEMLIFPAGLTHAVNHPHKTL